VASEPEARDDSGLGHEHRDRRAPNRDGLTVAALQARSGDESAAAAFVRGTQADVWRFCAHLADRASADDLTQETYARAFAALHRFAGQSSARTWLLAIARRVCADAVRVQVRERKLPGPARVVPDPSGAVTTRRLLAALEPQRREAFVLTQLVGLSYAEAADVCGCPVGTIRSRVARARMDLVEQWNAGGARSAAR
jgi:RNA polymerase sigma-70 factor (ECF subfamily)